MDFLSRFKGRTNFVTKEGIASLMTEASTPIEKVSEQRENPTPRARKIKAVSTQDNRRQVLPKGETEPLVSPKAATNQLRKLMEVKKQDKNSNLIKIPLHESVNFDREKRLIPIGSHTEYYTPQHRLIQQMEPHSADQVTFSQKLGSLGKNSFPHTMHGLSYSQIHHRVPESPHVKSEFNSPKFSHLQRPSIGRSITEERSGYESRTMNDLHESRIARMGFVERQEQVLNRYRSRPHFGPEVYAYGEVGRNWNPNLLLLSPKH